MPCAVQVSCLDDDGLMSEFKALQMLALYNGPGGADPNNPSEDGDKTSLIGTDPNSPIPDDTANMIDQAVTEALADEGKKCKHMDENLKEFLLQQGATQDWHVCRCMYSPPPHTHTTSPHTRPCHKQATHAVCWHVAVLICRWKWQEP